MDRRLDAMLEALLDAFFSGTGIEWRSELEGEKMILDARLAGSSGTIETITYLADGVRQVAPPVPFDAIADAAVLLQGD